LDRHHGLAFGIGLASLGFGFSSVEVLTWAQLAGRGSVSQLETILPFGEIYRNDTE